jgi:formylmethanofuran dehydrogenase subunit E
MSALTFDYAYAVAFSGQPPPALSVIEATGRCSRCGESVMASRLRETATGLLCGPCRDR